jgi:hypothetical protein
MRWGLGGPLVNPIPEWISKFRVWSRTHAAAHVEFSWYVFIAIIFGQFGAFFGVIKALWTGEDLGDVLAAQAAAGNFLTFSVALVTSSAFFFVRDYIRGRAPADNRTGRSFWLLVAAIVAVASTLVIFLLSQTTQPLTDAQLRFHWILYAASLVIAFRFWAFERVDDLKTEMDAEVEEMTKKSRSAKKTNSGVKI